MFLLWFCLLRFRFNRFHLFIHFPFSHLITLWISHLSPNSNMAFFGRHLQTLSMTTTTAQLHHHHLRPPADFCWFLLSNILCLLPILRDRSTTRFKPDFAGSHLSTLGSLDGSRPLLFNDTPIHSFRQTGSFSPPFPRLDHSSPSSSFEFQSFSFSFWWSVFHTKSPNHLCHHHHLHSFTLSHLILIIYNIAITPTKAK